MLSSLKSQFLKSWLFFCFHELTNAISLTIFIKNSISFIIGNTVFVK